MKRIKYQEFIRYIRKIKSETDKIEILNERYYQGKAVMDIKLNDDKLDNSNKKHFLSRAFDYASSYKIEIREGKLFFKFTFEFDEAKI